MYFKRKAIVNQLLEKGLKRENITVSNKDTRTDDDFYSHVAYKKGNIGKNGRFIRYRGMVLRSARSTFVMSNK